MNHILQIGTTHFKYYVLVNDNLRPFDIHYYTCYEYTTLLYDVEWGNSCGLGQEYLQ